MPGHVLHGARPGILRSGFIWGAGTAETLGWGYRHGVPRKEPAEIQTR